MTICGGGVCGWLCVFDKVVVWCVVVVGARWLCVCVCLAQFVWTKKWSSTLGGMKGVTGCVRASVKEMVDKGGTTTADEGVGDGCVGGVGGGVCDWPC